MSCSNPACQLPDCSDYNHIPQCCIVKPNLATPQCPVKVYVPACVPAASGTNLSGRIDCNCVPCPEEGLEFTAEQKSYIETVLRGLLQTISPYARCGCEIVDLMGHADPLKPAPMKDVNGEQLYYQEDGTLGTTVTDCPAFHSCCDANGNMHSPFLHSGVSIYGRMGIDGAPPSPIAGGDYNSMVFHENLGQLFCCALDKIAAAPTVVLEEVDVP